MKKIVLAGLVALPLMLMADMDRCVSCHGVDFELKALGVSKVVKDMTEDQIRESLNGYKVGKGGSMKEVMMTEVNVGVDTDAMAADVYNEIITPGFEEPDAEFIFKKRRTVRGLFKIKQALKKSDPKKDRKKVLSQIKSFAFDIASYDPMLRKEVSKKDLKAETLSIDQILKTVTEAKSCTDHSFTEPDLLKCRTDFVTLATKLSLDDAEKLKLKIKPKEKKEAHKAAPLTAEEAAKTIVGTWSQTCYPSGKPNEWASKEVTVSEDMSAKGGMQFFSDDKCTKQTKEIKAFYTFKFGNIVLGDDGKEAWEIDKVIGKKKKKVYAMLRFVDANRVIISGATKVQDGSSTDKRKNHFDASWEGCVRK
jgi:hypothetical protein